MVTAGSYICVGEPFSSLGTVGSIPEEDGSSLSGHSIVVNLLLARGEGAVIQKFGQNGYTPLQLTVEAGHVETVAMSAEEVD